MTEDRATRLKRLQMRSMRRGTKEMDILLVRFTEARLADMTDAQLDAYEAMMNENDQDLYQWISGQRPAPAEHADMIQEIIKVAANG
ncbi:succinate dehydrogenase assembly factor 2 [Tropicibacter naphthalenivorans]|uniref:FAD assembly factor SdhE n=1 Tax=Tropicibacter naphthalenivorans TaxID=441103 RepID=A0A0P1GVN1_9RHOB|nr:succinate dehydrogenase assembly factor 2 [Tropicibacter naphthalenivorans]CUH78570.1 Flavinator of succinate dehydrogenase [Tropicibacter naphthalenivorans]SMC80941.1 antitoxin CptB [Tropicibacter naphthalenivorans]